MKKLWMLLIAGVLLVIGIILNATSGNQFSMGAYTFNYFDSGDYAMGIFAAGTFSIGIFSIGIFSIGIFSIGIFNIGLYAIGIFVIGYKKKRACISGEYLSSNLKKTLVLIAIIAAQTSVFAQNKSRLHFSGGFGGPTLGLSTISSKPSLTIGGSGAAVFSNGLFLGGFGLGTSDMVKVPALDNNTLQAEYGGVWLGRLYKLSKKYKLSASIKVGFGETALHNEKLKQLLYDETLLLIPGASVSRRINAWSAIELGVFYSRFTGVDLHGYNSKDFSSPGISLMWKFGGGYF